MKKNNSKKENILLKKKIVEVSGVPSEVIFGVPIVTITGCHEIMISNYRGVLEYTDNMIRIQTKTGQIKVNGRKISMDYYRNEEMKISGMILSIEYC